MNGLDSFQDQTGIFQNSPIISPRLILAGWSDTFKRPMRRLIESSPSYVNHYSISFEEHHYTGGIKFLMLPYCVYFLDTPPDGWTMLLKDRYNAGSVTTEVKYAATTIITIDSDGQPQYHKDRTRSIISDDQQATMQIFQADIAYWYKHTLEGINIAKRR